MTKGSSLLSILFVFALVWFVGKSPSNHEDGSALDLEIRAMKIDAYFKKRGDPLYGYGKKFVSEAQKNGLDYRLLPAISILESTGGKFACKNNPLGWGSCKIGFKDWNEAIEVVALNLGGNNPRTKHYYDNGKTLDQKLYHYNSVNPEYNKKIRIHMEEIRKIPVSST